jgi:hypothetical protein
MKNTLFEEDKEQCKKLLIQIRPSEVEKYLKKKDFKGGIDFIRNKLEEEEVTQEIAHDLIQLYNEWINVHPDHVKNKLTEINNDFTKCINRLSPSLSTELIHSIQMQKHAVLVKAASSHLGEWDSVEKLEKSNKAMEALLEMDKTNYQAMLQLAAGLMHRGFAYAKNKEIEKAKKPLHDSYSYIKEIIQNCANENILKNAEELKKNLEGIIEKIGLD